VNANLSDSLNLSTAAVRGAKKEIKTSVNHHLQPQNIGRIYELGFTVLTLI